MEVTQGGSRPHQEVLVPFKQHYVTDEHCQPNLEVMVTPGAMLLLGGHMANMTTVLTLCNRGEDTHGTTGTIWHPLGMVFHRARATSVRAPVPGSLQCPLCLYPCPSVSTLPSVPLLSSKSWAVPAGATGGDTQPLMGCHAAAPFCDSMNTES